MNEALPKMKVAVTGAESFVGHALVPLLVRHGVDVVAIDAVAPPDGCTCGARHEVADVRSPGLGDAVPDGTDAIVHLAAVSTEPACAEDPATSFDVNVTGTANVIAVARSRAVGQVVFASSEWVYGDVAADGAQLEDMPIDVAGVRNEYAATKLAGEMALNVAVRRGLPSGTVLRFGIIYGPRPSRWSAVESLVQAVRAEDVVTVGCLATARRFIHVDDIAAGIASSLGCPGFEVFNLAGGELVTLGRVIEAAAAATGRHPDVVERDPGAVSVRNPVSAKAQDRLDWSPAVPIDVGVSDLVDYFSYAN